MSRAVRERPFTGEALGIFEGRGVIGDFMASLIRPPGREEGGPSKEFLTVSGFTLGDEVPEDARLNSESHLEWV